MRVLRLARMALVVAGAMLASRSALAAPPPKQDITELDAPEYSDTTWHQILMAPRITGNLRAVAVDPSNPKNVYVGTEEGTLVHSSDGGLTWDETEISAFTVESPTARIPLAGDDYKAIDVFGGFNVLVGTTYYPLSPLFRPSADVGPVLLGPPFPPQLPPYFIYPLRIGSAPEKLLDQVAHAPRFFEEVQRVRICPGGAHTVYVVTGSGKLWGSPDGATFVPLYFGRDDFLGDVACSPANPNLVVMASAHATHLSTDGGSSFDGMAAAIGGVGNAVFAFAPAAEGGKATLYAGGGGDVWIGDPAEPETMKPVSIGSEGGVTSIAVGDKDKEVWVATETGVRVSRDGGATWTAIDDLESFKWRQIAVSGDHVMVSNEDVAFESIDSGKTFHPAFKAESRRRMRQLVNATTPGGTPRFLLVTSGELWSTAPLDQGAIVSTLEMRKWAFDRLRKMPSQGDMVGRALVKARLTEQDVEHVDTMLHVRNWLPGVTLSATVTDVYSIQTSNVTLTAPTRTDLVQAQRNIGLFGNFVWQLPEVGLPSYEVVPVRRDLYTVRKDLEYVVEDAYDERKQVLTQMATSPLDAEQLLTLQTRLEVLDVVLDEFTIEKEKP